VSCESRSESKSDRQCGFEGSRPFAGNFDAAERVADGVTVVATARLHGLDPVAYLAWLLPQLARREWSDEAAGPAADAGALRGVPRQRHGRTIESTDHAAP
jgi:hypothetical protein